MDLGCAIVIAYIVVWGTWLIGIYARHKMCPNPRNATRREIYAREKEAFGRLAYIGWTTDILGTAGEYLLPVVLLWWYLR